MVTDKIFRIISPRRLIFKIIFRFCAISVCATFVMSIFFYKNTRDTINKNDTTFLDAYAKTVSDSIDSYILENDRIGKIILGNTQIQDIITRLNLPGYTQLKMINDYETIQNTILSFTSLRDFTSILIANKDGSIINQTVGYYGKYNSNMFDDVYIKENPERLAQGNFLLVPPYRTNITFWGNKPVFILARSLRSIEYNEAQAYIMIIFDLNILYSKLLENAPNMEGIKIDIQDKDGYIAMSLDRSRIGKKLSYSIDNEKTASYTSNITGWTSDIRMRNNYFQKGMDSKLEFLLPLTLIVIIGSFMIAVFMVSYVLKPIHHLVSAMKTVKKGNINIILEEKTNSSDVEALYNTFNLMVAEIKNLTKTVLDEKLLSKNAQLAALRYQINPHFFYNTLQTIEAIGEINGVSEIQVMAKSLGNLMRYNIRGSNVVSVAEEIEQMETYLKIEKIRFKNRLNYSISISEQAGRCRILKFILQPIVENCIIHGMRGYKGEGYISIDAYVDGGVLITRIYNSGIPISNDKLIYLNDGLKEILKNENAPALPESIGLMNAQKRIVKSFGNEYGVNFEYSDEGGTCVRLTIPADEGGKENV